MESLNGQLWQTLHEIIVTYGADICDEPARLEGLLRDQCGQYKREIRLLINTLKEGVVSELRLGKESMPVEVLIPRLCKKIEENLLLSPDVAEWAVKSWAVALGLLPSLPVSLSAREELDNILRSSGYTPDKLLEFFKHDFRKEFAADAGVWEKYTIERHTLMVMHQFEKYFSKKALPGDFKTDTFRVILAMHDIGVSLAIEEGTKRGMEVKEAKKVGQAIYTTKLMESAMGNLGFDGKEIDVAKALVSDDPIGSYLRSGNFPTASIRRMARESGMPLVDFFDLLIVFYMVDAGSYTEDAGGRKSLDFLFVFDKHRMQMIFSPETLNKINKLRKSIEW
jgi:hypothetical protein